MALNINGRALHYGLKIPDRKETMRFYREILGMQLIRHEKFNEPCKAFCNGLYKNPWTKSMVGYGPEDSHFLVELIYNHGVHSYEKGNDFISLSIRDGAILERAKAANWPILPENILEAPGGYRFQIINKPRPRTADPLLNVTLASSNLARSVEYWNSILGLMIFDRTEKTALLGFKENEGKVELEDIGEPVNRAKAYGRIAFSCPYHEQELIDEKIKQHNENIIVPLRFLDTPDKTTVRVIVLADPDGHEICFVDDESYRELSQRVSESERELVAQVAEQI